MIMVEDVLPRLKGVKNSPGGWTALCPAHEDTRNSLSVSQKEDRLLMHCHVGCTFQAVLEALNIPRYNRPYAPPQNVSRPPTRQRKVNTDLMAKLWLSWAGATEDDRLAGLARELGLTVKALRVVGACWSTGNDAWAFPMFDAAGEFCGIRLRGDNGDKWAVPGGANGVFTMESYQGVFHIVEGVTDLAALAMIGLNGIGLASSTSTKTAIAFCRQHTSLPCVVITDKDKAGLQATQELKKGLPSSKVCMLPFKDLRACLNNGMTHDDVRACLSASVSKVGGFEL